MEDRPVLNTDDPNQGNIQAHNNHITELKMSDSLEENAVMQECEPKSTDT